MVNGGPDLVAAAEQSLRLGGAGLASGLCSDDGRELLLAHQRPCDTLLLLFQNLKRGVAREARHLRVADNAACRPWGCRLVMSTAVTTTAMTLTIVAYPSQPARTSMRVSHTPADAAMKSAATVIAAATLCEGAIAEAIPTTAAPNATFTNVRTRS